MNFNQVFQASSLQGQALLPNQVAGYIFERRSVRWRNADVQYSYPLFVDRCQFQVALPFSRSRTTVTCHNSSPFWLRGGWHASLVSHLPHARSALGSFSPPRTFKNRGANSSFPHGLPLARIYSRPFRETFILAIPSSIHVLRPRPSIREEGTNTRLPVSGSGSPQPGAHRSGWAMHNIVGSFRNRFCADTARCCWRFGRRGMRNLGVRF